MCYIPTGNGYQGSARISVQNVAVGINIAGKLKERYWKKVPNYLVEIYLLISEDQAILGCGTLTFMGITSSGRGPICQQIRLLPLSSRIKQF